MSASLSSNKLASGLSSSASDLRDIKPPVEIPNPWAWVWWTVAALVVAAALYLAWRHWQKRRALVALVPPIPPHVRAKQRLREALALISDPREFCIRVSDTLRTYLEERFTFHAPERTTEEFLYELRDTELLTRDQKESLEDFLTRCDLVKFARYEPLEPELMDLHASALRTVEETEPLATAADAAPGAHSPDSTPVPTQS
jgi:hypothetical protein